MIPWWYLIPALSVGAILGVFGAHLLAAAQDEPQ